MQSHSHEQTRGDKKRERLNLKRRQITGLGACIQMDKQIYAHFFPFSNMQNSTHIQSVWQLKRLSPGSFESASKPDKFNRCKNKGADGGDSTPHHLPRLHLRLPAFLPSHLCCFLGWLTGCLQWEYWMKGLFYPASQPVSQSPREGGFGWGEQPGFRLWSPGVMTEPQAEKSGESLPQACLSIYPALSWQVLFHSAASTSFQTYSVYTYICVFAGADTSLGSYLGEGKKKKQSFSESSSHAVCVTLLDTDLWWKELHPVSSVCEPTSGNIPGGLFCIFFVCECVCAHVSGRVYLGRVNVVEHYYGCAVVVQHQSPEVLYCVWQRVLGHNECRRLLVTLEEKRETKGKRNWL